MDSSKSFFKEQWRQIKGYEGLYIISCWGRIMALDYRGRGECRILNLTCTKGKYTKVTLRDMEGIPTTFWVHRLVAQAFIPNPKEKQQVDHIDGDRFNNNATNLRWVDAAENSNNPNTKSNYHRRYHKPGEWQRRSDGQKKRFADPEERARLLVISAKGRATARRNRQAKQLVGTPLNNQKSHQS